MPSLIAAPARQRWLIWGLAAVSVVSVIMSIATLIRSGSGWDTPFEIELAAGVLDGLPQGLQAAYDATPYLFEFYGTINYAVLQALGIQLNPMDHSVYVALGLLNLTIAIAAVSALSYAVARTLASSVAGWLLAALVLSTPLWMGQLALDPKDIPTASGLTLACAGLIISWQASRRRFDVWLAPVLIALGTAELIGSRASGTVLLGVLVVGSWVASWFNRRVVASSFVGVVAGLAIVWLQSPFARRGMVRWLADAATTSNLSGSPVRFAGSDVNSASLPLSYIPGYFLAQLPVLTTLLLIGGCVVVLLGLLGRLASVSRQQLWALVPVGIQGLALPAMIAASHAIIYDAVRHVLFALPAFMVLAVLPFHVALSGDIQARWGRIGIGALTGLAIGASLFAGFRWFPYEYAFVNPVAGHDKVNRGWELDYWGLSAREGVDRLRELGASSVAVIPSPDPAKPFGAVSIDALRGLPGPHAVYVFNRYDASLPPECPESFRIVRDGHALGVGGMCRS